MGTTYPLYKSDKTEIELDEMSNKLSLGIGIEDTYSWSEKLTPEQVIEIALQMLKVCSYWTEEGTVEKAIVDFKAKGYHW